MKFEVRNQDQDSETGKWYPVGDKQTFNTLLKLLVYLAHNGYDLDQAVQEGDSLTLPSFDHVLEIKTIA